MRADLFDFDLPDESIALRPARPRDSARMLCVAADGEVRDRIVRDLPACFEPGEVLVLNDSRVIPAALEGVRPARPNGENVSVKINLIERLASDQWRGFAKPGRRLKPGDEIRFASRRFPAATLCAWVVSKAEDGTIILRFERSGADLDEAFRQFGMAPLPPYIADKRLYDDQDFQDYQTIYAAEDGSIAAPTAGLHFTQELIDALKRRGVQIAYVRLHVGAGTFLPVKSEDVRDHVMHSEHFEISKQTAALINGAKREGRRVTAVGTTSLRALESAATLDDGLGVVTVGEKDTRIFITPGYRFQIVDRLMTNFHLPKSTLFMLVSAFSGLDRMQAAYRRAIETGYRFYSYGDACLLERADG